TLCSPDSEPLLRVISVRARARSDRWRRGDLFPTASATTRAIRAVTDEPDLAAYLGGWG
ncbi:MAG: glycosyltransferase, partial [Microbacterium sp.]|nr:glycosyltransferase [Microbacterium sp.]